MNNVVEEIRERGEVADEIKKTHMDNKDFFFLPEEYIEKKNLLKAKVEKRQYIEGRVRINVLLGKYKEGTQTCS